MNKKPLRIAISVTREEYDKIKVLAGIASLSAYIRSRIFSKDEETMKNTSLKGWVELLNQVPDNDVLLKRLISDAKEMRSGKTAELFVNKLYQYGYRN